jgi:hypothetical protein
MTNNQVSSGRVWSKLAVLIGFLSILGLQMPPLRAQVVGATLSGTVNDASGAVVPKADITITDTDTGVTRTVWTKGPKR